MKILRKIYLAILYGFAIIGFILMLAYVVSKSDLVKQNGAVDKNYDYFSRSRNLLDNITYTWLSTEEYISLKESMKNEQVVLARVEKETGIKPRLLISILFVEQMRLYTSDRELFKKVFEPLKLLGVQSQYSWGVLGLKQETLIEIEKKAENNSQFKKLLTFSPETTNVDETRFNRVTDEHDHYYTYLYAAIYLKEVEKQWQDAGFDISGKPEILATLYNIGFANSRPNADPQVGGAEINIGTTKYTFGRLAYEFYYSQELLEEFPR